MRRVRACGLPGRGACAGARLVAVLAILLGAFGSAPIAAAQEEEYEAFVPDSVFEATPRTPVSYQSQYTRDKARGYWSQMIGYTPVIRRFSINVSATTNTSEDLGSNRSKSTAGDFFGSVNWRATPKWVWSLDGRASMGSVSDGANSSNSEQRRNRLALQSQYRVDPIPGARLMVLGRSDVQRNYDLRDTERLQRGTGGDPDVIAAQRDSAFSSGRLDALRGQLDWTLTPWVRFSGKLSGSWSRPSTRVRRVSSSVPTSGGGATVTEQDTTVVLPADNNGREATLIFTPLRATSVSLLSRVANSDQVYFDLGQLSVEQFSNDLVRHSLSIQSVPLPGTVFKVDATLNRSQRVYVARPNLNALVTTREIGSSAAYSTPTTTLYANLIVNRSRAEQQTNGNGITLTRTLTTNLSRRLLGRVYLVGQGIASLNSLRYENKADDRDLVTGAGNLGIRFALTPRCSTAWSFGVNNVHQISIDANRSATNLATTVYQLNGAVRLPMHRNLLIGQDYVLSATYRSFDYNADGDDLTRNFRIDTIVADTLFPLAFLRLDHRYFYFDRGDFTPAEPGGPRLYGIQQKQYQQTLIGTIGVRPVLGITLLVAQSLADTDNEDVGNRTRQGTQQWNLSLGLEVNRSFWNGAGLTGAIRRESKYQNLSSGGESTNREDHWLAGISFQKEF